MDSHSTDHLPDHRDARLLGIGAAPDDAVDAYWLAEDALRDGSERMAVVIDDGLSLRVAITERACARPAQMLDQLRSRLARSRHWAKRRARPTRCSAIW